MVMNTYIDREGPLLPGYRQSQAYWMGCPEVPKPTSSSPAGGSRALALSLKAVEVTKAQKLMVLPTVRAPMACWGQYSHSQPRVGVG